MVNDYTIHGLYFWFDFFDQKFQIFESGFQSSSKSEILWIFGVFQSSNPILPIYEIDIKTLDRVILIDRSLSNIQNLVEPGCCTNHVENYWMQLKRKLKSMVGAPNTTIESHISEFLWRERNGIRGQVVFNNLLRQIAARFPVNQWVKHCQISKTCQIWIPSMPINKCLYINRVSPRIVLLLVSCASAHSVIHRTVLLTLLYTGNRL